MQFLIGSLILLNLISVTNLAFATRLKNANAPGAIGETGHLYLIDQGIFSRPFYNDVFGDTDKHLTGATQIGWLSVWSQSSLEVIGHWRFLTPSYFEKFGSKPLQSPVGRYADWMELQTVYSVAQPIGSHEFFKFQFNIGVGHVGNKGAQQVHRKFHALIGSSLEGLDYTNQPKGSDISRGLEVAYIASGNRNLEYMPSFGFHYNKFMFETYLKFNLLSTISQTFSLAAEGKVAHQIQSFTYDRDEFSNARYESAIGLRWHWWRPSLKYISPYLYGDTVGQIYFDPIAFSIDL